MDTVLGIHRARLASRMQTEEAGEVRGSINDEQRSRVVAFLTATGMFIFTTSFPVIPTRSHDHPQLGFITPIEVADGNSRLTGS